MRKKIVDHLDTESQEQFSQILKILGKQIRDWRKKMGLSGRAFAERAGIDHWTLVAIETGTTNVSLVVIFMVAQAAGWDMKAFIEGFFSSEGQAAEALIAAEIGAISQDDDKAEGDPEK